MMVMMQCFHQIGWVCRAPDQQDSCNLAVKLRESLSKTFQMTRRKPADTRHPASRICPVGAFIQFLFSRKVSSDIANGLLRDRLQCMQSFQDFMSSNACLASSQAFCVHDVSNFAAGCCRVVKAQPMSLYWPFQCHINKASFRSGVKSISRADLADSGLLPGFVMPIEIFHGVLKI